MWDCHVPIHFPNPCDGQNGQPRETVHGPSISLSNRRPIEYVLLTLCDSAHHQYPEKSPKGPS